MSDEGEDFPQGGPSPSVREILRVVENIFWWIFYPIGVGLYYLVYYLAFAVVFLLRLFYKPIAFVLLPIVYLLQVLWACFLAPFRFLAKFEVNLRHNYQSIYIR